MKNEFSEELQSFNREILIDALERIKLNTTYLWSDLELAYENKQTRIQSTIRKTTFTIIKNDLELLKSYDLLNYSCEYTGNLRNDFILKITIEIHDNLFELIKIIQERSRPLDVFSA